jgi:UPF0755 protein
VTESNPPSNGGKAAPSSQPTPARAAEKPAAQPARPAPPASAVPPKATPPRPANGGAAAAPAAGSAPRPAAAPVARAAPPARPAVMPAAASTPRPSSNAPADDRFPFVTQRLANAAGAPPPELSRTDSSRADSARITPRSPRAAIEPDTVGLPIRRSASARHPLVVIGNAVISIFVLLAVVTGVVLFIGKQRFEESGPLPEDRIVNIPRGSGMRDIADVLTREGVIDQPWVFIGSVLVLKAREDLKAGEYQFKAHSSLRDVVATMVEGKVVPHLVSVPEGLTSDQIVGRLLQDDVLIGDVKSIPPEGSLLPDTYNFTRGVTREQLIQRMQQADQHLVREIWEHRAADLPLKTPDQLVTLASIIEKETGKPEERTRVAAVFVNRLKQKIKLQSDPTIIYGLVGGKGTLGRPIMKSEIERPTPYNTYVIDGLPPGPITNPGRASLEAAANPARTRELYFVADGTGGHVFAETYDQHQKNVARLRAPETDQKDQAPLDSQSPPPNVPAPAQAQSVPVPAAPIPATAPTPAPITPPVLHSPAKPHPKPLPTQSAPALGPAR